MNRLHSLIEQAEAEHAELRKRMEDMGYGE